MTSTPRSVEMTFSTRMRADVSRPSLRRLASSRHWTTEEAVSFFWRRRRRGIRRRIVEVSLFCVVVDVSLVRVGLIVGLW